jgi:hypothetical protein
MSDRVKLVVANKVELEMAISGATVKTLLTTRAERAFIRHCTPLA